MAWQRKIPHILSLLLIEFQDHLFTYVLGSDMSEEERVQLSDITNIPKFIDDGDVGDLMVSMGTYYEQADYLYDSKTAKTVMTLPYYDYDGLGVVLTAAAPIFRNVGNFKNVTSIASEQERYVGVVGIDMAVADIFKDLVDIHRHFDFGRSAHLT